MAGESLFRRILGPYAYSVPAGENCEISVCNAVSKYEWELRAHERVGQEIDAINREYGSGRADMSDANRAFES